MEWDDEVDVVCAGAGAAGLAHAIALGDLGGEVFLADWGVAERSWLGADTEDECTRRFFAEMTSDLGPPRRQSDDLGVPVRAVPSHPPADTGRTVAPFVGSRLRDWAAQCLATPFGYLSTRLPDWSATTVQASDDQILEVLEIGALAADSDDLSGSVVDLLTNGVAARGIAVHADHALQRLVFEEGVAVGAVFTTPGGPTAVRARHGVTVTSGAMELPQADGRSVSGDILRVCLVGQRASRFGRVEVLTAEPLALSGSTCHARGRRLHDNLRETYRHSGSWRCGKLHGYPSLGE
ncbi:FAD-binding protein [Mycolicibacterium celeriflavum]|uniref:FAD-binding protein n=1 Tax=Mycolicibacterium celeriflavum TaxID=1249101 RepID=UPI003CE7F033